MVLLNVDLHFIISRTNETKNCHPRIRCGFRHDPDEDDALLLLHTITMIEKNQTAYNSHTTHHLQHKKQFFSSAYMVVVAPIHT